MVKELDRAHTDASLEQKLFDCVHELLESSLALRKAITSRSPDRIWETLAAQEEQAAMLEEYGKLWEELNEMQESNSGGERGLRRQIREDLTRLCAIQQSNSQLAQHFLSAIRKALGEVGNGASTKKRIYDRRGRMSGRSRSVLVRRQG